MNCRFSSLLMNNGYFAGSDSTAANVSFSFRSASVAFLLNDKAKKWVGLFTKNTLMGVLTGTVLTILLDSSSAVIILTIVLVNTKTLRFENSLGIILGANIGTTFSSQLIALDIGKYSPIPIFIGFLLSVISKSKSVSGVGKTLLYFGIMFFGLYTMERSVEPLREQKEFLDWMTKLENPFKGAGVGALVTLVLQSSSATVGMVITLATRNSTWQQLLSAWYDF
ncbi:MAG: Na/Pi cotransporter family protein [Chitinophagaceae bacterium]|nr:MAG: Na/Pi cotransporter family protein [Chitinophagaceae bacterium]